MAGKINLQRPEYLDALKMLPATYEELQELWNCSRNAAVKKVTRCGFFKTVSLHTEDGKKYTGDKKLIVPNWQLLEEIRKQVYYEPTNLLELLERLDEPLC